MQQLFIHLAAIVLPPQLCESGLHFYLALFSTLHNNASFEELAVNGPVSMSSYINTSPQPLAILYFMESMMVSFRNALTAQAHSHDAVQITLDFDGEFEVHSNDTVKKYRCVLIPPNVSHNIVANGHWQMSILLDAQVSLTKQLLQHFNATDTPVEIPQDCLTGILSTCQNTYQQPLAVNDLSHLLRQELGQWVSDISLSEQDARIDSLIQAINRSENLDDMEQIINNIPLSKSRVSHLFVEYAGLTLRRYVLWKRVRKAVEYILQGESITDSAHHAGFSDLSHLSRSFKAMFGLNISVLFQAKDFIHFQIE